MTLILYMTDTFYLLELNRDFFSLFLIIFLFTYWTIENTSAHCTNTLQCAKIGAPSICPELGTSLLCSAPSYRLSGSILMQALIACSSPIQYCIITFQGPDGTHYLFSQFMVDLHHQYGKWVFCFQLRFFFRHAKRAETTVQVYRGKNQE